MAPSGPSNGGFDLGLWRQKWGNFISANGLDSGRFLDPPELHLMHDNGNEENFFDRVDYQLSQQIPHFEFRLYQFLVSDTQFL